MNWVKVLGRFEDPVLGLKASASRLKILAGSEKLLVVVLVVPTTPYGTKTGAPRSNLEGNGYY